MKTLLSATFFMVFAMASAAHADSYKCVSVDQDVQIDVVGLQSMEVLNPTQDSSRQHLIDFNVAAGNLVFADTTATAQVVTTSQNAGKHLAGTSLSQIATIAITFDTHYRQLASDGKPVIAADVVYTRRNQQQLSQDFTCAIE